MTLQQPISITAIASISPLGFLAKDIWQHYQSNNHCFSDSQGNFVATLPISSREKIEELRRSNSKYKNLDNSVLYAIFAAREATKAAGWNASDNFGINVGSSRGATELFETYHQKFLEHNSAETLSSPTTTLGNISSWIAHDLRSQGPEISHSITCSTALHAMLNGIAWINSGMSDKFLVGGSEAPLTRFTIAQMQALKIYCDPNQLKTSAFPNQALNLDKTKNSMILSEAAAMACLEPGISNDRIATIKGFGYATEVLEHNASLSTNAECFQRSMTMAIGSNHPEDIDVIVTHTPGTVKGDQAEFNAITSIFCNKIPALTTNKWKIGHSLGASGLLNIEMAVMMLQHQEFLSIPYLKQDAPQQLNNILVNAVGFGGNAVSILLSK